LFKKIIDESALFLRELPMLRNILKSSLNALFLLFTLAVHPSHHPSDKPTSSQNSPHPMNTHNQALRLTSLTTSPTPQLIDKNDHKINY